MPAACDALRADRIRAWPDPLRDNRSGSVTAPMPTTPDAPDHRVRPGRPPGHIRRKEQDMSNDELERWVSDELFWDPKVDSAAIAVVTDDGKVTLRGTVGSFREKREAQKDAERVYGVTSVDNELKVRLLTTSRREDADLRGDVLQALMLDSLVPATIDAKVEDGWVTLSGKAEWQYQRDEAEFIAGNVFGVIGVDDEIELTSPQPKAGDVKESIEKSFKRNAKLDAKSLAVNTHDGTVSVSGTVGSWGEHDEAIEAAWAAPGVTNVEDDILVAY
jgi:osmotically-inducible protein OsmY